MPIKRPMRSGRVVESLVFLQQPIDVLFVDRDDVIKQFLSQRSVESFNYTVLPRTAYTGTFDRIASRKKLSET